MEYIPRLDHFAVEAIYGGPNTFGLEFGTVAESGVATGKALVGSESRIVGHHCVGGASVRTAFFFGCVVDGNAGGVGRYGGLSNGVEFRGEKLGQSPTSHLTTMDLTLFFRNFSGSGSSRW